MTVIVAMIVIMTETMAAVTTAIHGILGQSRLILMKSVMVASVAMKTSVMMMTMAAIMKVVRVDNGFLRVHQLNFVLVCMQGPDLVQTV